jgi:thymidylate synthase (FAD)
MTPPHYRCVAFLIWLSSSLVETSSSGMISAHSFGLEMQQAGSKILSAEERTDLRKKVQQCARSVLPNETEAPIAVTGNARAWCHFIEMRASPHAETEIRELAVRVFLCLHLTYPILFGDHTLEQLPAGTYTAKTEFEKV